MYICNEFKDNRENGINSQIKTIMKKFLFGFIVFALLIHAKAFSINYDFAVDGIGYRFESVEKKTVNVATTLPGFDGIYVVPSEVEFNGITFTVDYIAVMAFSSSWVKNVTIPSTINYIQEGAFYNSEKSIETLIIEDSPDVLDCTMLHGINDYDGGQFTCTKIKNLYLGRDLTYVPYSQYYRDYRPFGYLNTLETVEIGEYVTDASHLDLRNCNNLKNIKLYGGNTTYIPQFTNMQYVTLPVIVPKGELDKYKASSWGKFYNLMEEESSSSKLNFVYDEQLGSVYVNRQFVEDEISLPNGSDAQITIIPNQGIEIRSVMVNGEERIAEITNNTLYLNNVNGDMTIQIVLSAPQRMVRMIVDGGTYGIAVENGSALDLFIEPDEGWSIKNVFVDGKNCTASLVNNRLSFDAVTDDHLVQTVFEDNIDYVNEIQSSKVDVTIEGKRIIVHNAGNDPLRIFDTKGHLLYEGQSEIYTAPRMGIYIVEVGKNKYKIAL